MGFVGFRGKQTVYRHQRFSVALPSSLASPWTLNWECGWSSRDLPSFLLFFSFLFSFLRERARGGGGVSDVGGANFPGLITCSLLTAVPDCVVSTYGYVCAGSSLGFKSHRHRL